MKNLVFMFAITMSTSAFANVMLDCPLYNGSSDIYRFQVVKHPDGKIYKELELSGSKTKIYLAKPEELAKMIFRMRFTYDNGAFTNSVKVVVEKDGYGELTSLKYASKYVADLDCKGALIDSK